MTGVDFMTMKNRLVTGLRLRLRNGELTERRLAVRVGLSQSHMHNVLKGKRDLTLEVADRILRELKITALDLFERDELMSHLGHSAATEDDDSVTMPSYGPRPGDTSPAPV